MRIAIVGYGEGAQARHIPAIAATPEIDLVAIVSPDGGMDGIPWFATFDDLLGSDTDFSAVALCTPPQVRAHYAALVLHAGRHVLLDSPSCAGVDELTALSKQATSAGLSVFVTWHARYTNAVRASRTFIAENGATSIKIDWLGKTHAHDSKQDSSRDPAWQPGGLGVFDVGIDALSILTEIVPERLTVTAAELLIPDDRQAPIAATLQLSARSGLTVNAHFDLRQQRDRHWEIDVQSGIGAFALSNAGKLLTMEGRIIADGPTHEYQDVYRRFLDLVQRGGSDVDTAPFGHVADALSLGRRIVVEPAEH